MSETENIRFKVLNKIAKFRLVVNSTGCWIIEETNIRRYSTVIFSKKEIKLHILSAIIFNNHDIENKNIIVCHKCDIEGCCNPSHLYTGTYQTNGTDRRVRRKFNIPKGQVINQKEYIPPHNPKFDLIFSE